VRSLLRECACRRGRYLRGKGNSESEKLGLEITGVEITEGEAQCAHSGLTLGSSHDTFARTIGGSREYHPPSPSSVGSASSQKSSRFGEVFEMSSVVFLLTGPIFKNNLLE
jgi:hypothetical protein